MTRSISLIVLLVFPLAAPAPAAAGPAGQCAVGPGLGATLLIPYFEADPTSFDSVTTLINVVNGAGFPVLARVVMWTDWGVPTLAFDIYLGGWDIVTINVRDILWGNVVATGGGVDLTAFPYCDLYPPDHANPALYQQEANQLIAYHTGIAGPMDSRCAGEAYGDGIARGYITIDVVDECSGLEIFDPVYTPANTSYPYFEDGGGSNGIAISDNALWGDITYIDSANNFAQALEAVAIWADPSQFSGSNIYTFYGRFSSWDGRDDRVPLPSLWDQRFYNGGPFSGGADLIAWRDTGMSAAAPVSCGSTPPWYPLQATLTQLDEDASGYNSLPAGSLPAATQRVSVGAMGVTDAAGWIQVDTGARQSWVLPSLAAFGRYSATFNGIPVGFLCGSTPPP